MTDFDLNALRSALRWTTGQYVGGAAPELVVYVRKGVITHRYEPWHGEHVKALIKGHIYRPYQGFWQPTSDWKVVPNALSAEVNQSFDENGLRQLSLDVENIYYETKTGIAGLFRAIRRGWLSPYRGNTTGYATPVDPQTGEKLTKNDWFEYLAADRQIMVLAGYGADGLVPVFTGLIDSLDLTSKPDRLTITARDFGQFLVDQKAFGRNKDPSVRDPIVFADRKDSFKEKPVAAGVRASSSSPDHSAHKAIDGDGKGQDRKTYWLSAAALRPDNTEWIEIHLPEGQYEDFFIECPFANMECYVSLYATKLKHKRIVGDKGQPGAFKSDMPGIDGHLIDTGWVAGDDAIGIVPDDPDGDDGGHHYVKLFHTIKGNRKVSLPFKLHSGDGTRLRLSFRNLHKMRPSHEERRRHSGVDYVYKTGLKRFAAYKEHVEKVASKDRYILVEDISDVVRVVLRWVGFKDWDVEDTGVRLSSPMIVNRQTYFSEIIAKMSELTGYCFFISPPTDLDSIGVPHFRNPAFLTGGAALDPDFVVADSNLLTGIKYHFDDSALAYNIRVRGKRAKPKGGGVTLGGGSVPGSKSDRRIMATYYPPWGHARGRRVQVAKQVVHVDPQLTTVYQCRVGAILIALAEAMASASVVVEVPWVPGLGLDQVGYVTDTATGLNTRIYVAQQTITMSAGASKKWVMSLQAALLDTPDVQGVYSDWIALDAAEIEAEKTKAKTPKPPALTPGFVIEG